MNLPRSFLLPIAAALLGVAAHLILWLLPVPIIQAFAALLLTGWLPGLLAVDLFFAHHPTPPGRGEWLLYGIAVGYALQIVGMLLLSYLPGGLSQFQVLLAFDLLLILLLVWRVKRGGVSATFSSGGISAWTVAGLLILLGVAGFLRLTNLGYAEFHGDEARGVLRAAAVLQGYEDVLFLHKKGPTEIVLPTLLFALLGHLNEATARLPFAVANLAALLAIWLLGRRLFGNLAGWLAAFLLAFDGYLIAFARFVQYQSVVLLMLVLLVVIGYRIWRSPETAGRYWTFAALLWAAGLLSHYDALAGAVPIGFLLGAMLWRRPAEWWPTLRVTLPAIGLGALLLALFYVPYLLHPGFENTVTYLVDQRFVVGQRFPFNSLHELIRRTLVYNSSYYVALMAGGALLALLVAYRRGLGGARGLALGIVLALLLGWTAWQTTWLRIGAVDYAIVPFAVALIGVALLPNQRFETRLVWVWFGVLAIVMIFGMALARTHIYVFFAPWSLLVGGLFANAWAILTRPVAPRLRDALGGLGLVAISIGLGGYDYWYYVHNRVEVLKTWPEHHPAGYWTPSYTKEVDSLYGFPLANGWKVVGALYNSGVLRGDYETNQRYLWIPQWYTLGQNRCGSTAEWYFAIDNLESWSLRSADAEDMLKEQGYVRWGQVTVEDRPQMVIYRQGDRAQSPPVQTFALEAYAAQFDDAMTPALPLASPIIEEPIQNPQRINFGNDVWLEGFAIEGNEGLQPGESFRLTLYWRAQRTGIPSYKVFNQAFYGDGVMVAQKDAIPVCDREPTSLWYPGELIVDVHEIPIAADAPPGVYPLYTGLYQEEGFVRTPVLDEAGNPVAEFVHLADVQIVAAE